MHAGTGRVLAVLLCLAAVGSQSAGAEKREKVAEGEYVMQGAQKENRIRELWTLWRSTDGRYVVMGEVRYSAIGPASARNLQYELNLGEDLKPLNIRLTYREVEGASILFEFGSNELRFRGERAGLERPEEATLPISAPYTFYPGFSSWQLGLLCKDSKAAQHERASVRFVFVDDPPPEPIGLHPFEAYVEHVGEEQVEVEGHRHAASRFEVNAAWPERANDPGPRLTAWVLPEGVLAAAKWKDVGQLDVRLVRYKKYAEFGPGK